MDHIQFIHIVIMIGLHSIGEGDVDWLRNLDLTQVDVRSINI